MTTFDDLVGTFALRHGAQASDMQAVTEAADPALAELTALPTFRGAAADWLLAQLADGELHKVIRLLDGARDAGITRERLMQAKEGALRGRIADDIRIDAVDGSMAAAWRLRPQPGSKRARTMRETRP